MKLRFRKKKYKKLRCVPLPRRAEKDFFERGECRIELTSKKPAFKGQILYLQERFCYERFEIRGKQLLVDIRYIDGKTREFDVMVDYLEELRGNKTSVTNWFFHMRQKRMARKTSWNLAASHMPFFAVRHRVIVQSVEQIKGKTDRYRQIITIKDCKWTETIEK